MIWHILTVSRKTGLTVPDTGIRDEHGIEPMDELFSSPEKAQPMPSVRKSVTAKSPNTTITSEEDMDVGEGSTIPEPTAVLTERKRVSLQVPLPRSKSPVKTYLRSPARRHPSLGPVSSPTRGSIVSPMRVQPKPPVARRLDFSVDDIGGSGNAVPRLAISPPKTAPQRIPVGPSPTPKQMNGLGAAPKSLKPTSHSYEDSRGSQQENHLFDLNSSREYGDDYQPLNDDGQGPGSPEREGTETPPEPIPPRPKKRGRPSLDRSESAKRIKVGRPKKISSTAQAKEHVTEKEDEVRDEHEEDEPEPELPLAKKQRIPAKSAKNSEVKQKAPVKPKPKPVVRRQESPPKDSSPVQVQRGPPRPKQNGLFILRRETPGLGNFQTTRSGRASVKPVAYWKNEAVVYGEDAAADGDESFILPTVKEVIRLEEVETEKSRKGKKRGRKAQKRQEEDEEDEKEEPVEPWESEPGRVYGEIRTWDPEDPIGSETVEKEEELAYSNAAILTREIPGSNVKFAKTLTLPFFGSGMVDLPPGAFKKPKNSRKMQMVFFVHYGKVKVEINGNSFRISKGGIFQIPRGKISDSLY